MVPREEKEKTGVQVVVSLAAPCRIRRHCYYGMGPVIILSRKSVAKGVNSFTFIISSDILFFSIQDSPGRPQTG